MKQMLIRVRPLMKKMAILCDGERSRLLCQALLVGTLVAPPQPQGGGNEPSHDKQCRYLGVPGWSR